MTDHSAVRQDVIQCTFTNQKCFRKHRNFSENNVRILSRKIEFSPPCSYGHKNLDL